MKFSIVIPNYNGAKLLAKNIPFVINAANGNEVIVVDDASTDDSIKLLKKDFPSVKIISHKKNLRFAKACNSGVNQAKGEIIVLLNSDVSPEKDFLKPLEKHFHDSKVFAVGFLEKSSTGTRGKSVGKFEKGFLFHSAASDRKPGISLWAFGGSAAFDRRKWIELGGMDEIFSPAYWEDIDLSYRAWKRGWEVRFDPESIVHHEPESTNLKELGKRQIKIISVRNQLLFVWKNIHDPKYILSHICFFPYHLISAAWRGDSAFLIGSSKALLMLIDAMQLRKKEIALDKLKDEDILKLFNHE